jgi:hypothetical protein
MQAFVRWPMMVHINKRPEYPRHTPCLAPPSALNHRIPNSHARSAGHTKPATATLDWPVTRVSALVP